MKFVLASVLLSVLVSVLLKLAPRWRIQIAQAVAWNYLVAGLATWFLLDPSPALLRSAALPWPTLGALALLLPTIFLVLAEAVRHAGIARSDVAQRLSLIVPLIAAFVIFGERVTAQKLIACTLGLVALAGLAWRPAGGAGGGRGAVFWPLGVFVGFGVIDVLFKRVAAAGVPLGVSLQIVFALAFPIALVLAKWRGARFDLRSLIGGSALGLANFGNIHFYLKAHRALPHEPAVVFASMNLGVVILGSLTGVLLFGERLSRLNVAALVLAIVAVALLA